MYIMHNYNHDMNFLGKKSKQISCFNAFCEDHIHQFSSNMTSVKYSRPAS